MVLRIMHVNPLCRDAYTCKPHGETGPVEYQEKPTAEDCDGTCADEDQNYRTHSDTIHPDPPEKPELKKEFEQWVLATGGIRGWDEIADWWLERTAGEYQKGGLDALDRVLRIIEREQALALQENFVNKSHGK